MSRKKEGKETKAQILFSKCFLLCGYRVFLRVKTEQEVVDEEAHRELTLSEAFQNHKKQRSKADLVDALSLYKIL